MYSLVDLDKAKARNNYAEVNKIAAFLMAYRLDKSGHYGVAMDYAWSLEMMGRWEEALEHYTMLVTVYRHDLCGYKMAALVSTRVARVQCKLGRIDAANSTLEALIENLPYMQLDDKDRASVLSEIERVRATS